MYGKPTEVAAQLKQQRHCGLNVSFVVIAKELRLFDWVIFNDKTAISI